MKVVDDHADADYGVNSDCDDDSDYDVDSDCNDDMGHL